MDSIRRIPNTETIKAMEETEKGKSFNTMEELLKYLNNGEEE